MTIFISDVMKCYDQGNEEKVPPFLRGRVPDEYLQTLGVELIKHQTNSRKPTNQIQSEEHYNFNRWIWIQFAWIALQNASMTYGGGHTRQQKAKERVITRSPSSSSPSTGEKLSIRDNAMIRITNHPSTTLTKLDKLKSESAKPKRRTTSTTIPFSSGTTYESKLELDAKESETGNRYKMAVNQLHELKRINDQLSAEAVAKQTQLNERKTEQQIRQVGAQQSHKRTMSDGEDALEALQNRWNS